MSGIDGLASRTSAAAPARVRWLALLVLIGVFAGGALAGAGTARVASPPLLPPPLLTFREELGLSPDQQMHVREIEQRHHPELVAILRPIFPKVRAISDQIEAE